MSVPLSQRACLWHGEADVLAADKSRIVEEGNYHKFTKSKSDQRMLRKLLDTGDRELVEVCCTDNREEAQD